MTMYIQRRETPPYEIGGYISEVNTFGSMLTNTDHQTNYKSIESYKWIVKFPKYHYIKLVFTQIELSRRKVYKFKALMIKQMNQHNNYIHTEIRSSIVFHCFKMYNLFCSETVLLN